MLPQNSQASLLIYKLLASFIFLLLLCEGCVRAPLPPPTPVPPPAAPLITAPLPPPSVRERRSNDYIVLIATKSDTYESLAGNYLGNEKLSYIISEYNKNAPVTAGKTIIIPLKPVNPGGIYPDGYQTVPILCYHRFSAKKSSNKTTVSAETFDRQMAYLKNNGYTVITLKDLYDFMDYRRRPPAKSVLITMDDGWKTAKTIAYPILKKYGFPAVLFVNTDNIKTRQNPHTLSWNELKELKGTGLFEIESHSVTHADLSGIPDEQLHTELEKSKRMITSILGTAPSSIAYPYGLFNGKVVDMMKKYGYKAGFTVIRGGNASFSSPYAINRSMIYHSEKIEDFAKSLQTFRQD